MKCKFSSIHICYGFSMVCPKAHVLEGWFPVWQYCEGVEPLRGVTQNQVQVAHACNPCYSEGRDQEDHGSKPAQANSV
jgi:hypothetical protein